MPILAAEIQFRKGLAALAEHDPAVAVPHFQQAIQIERQRAAPRPQMRYLSYYGYALAASGGATMEAIRACEAAARRDFFNPDLLLNLGRVYMLAGKTTRALATFEEGLRLAPSHAALRAEVAKHDRRSTPPLSVLPRNHPLNKFFGRLRASVAARARAPRSPVTTRSVTPS